jgi:ABC-type antimicrobial peptide transport system permease subunit
VVTQFMKGILFGVNTTDPLTFLVVAFFLGAVAALASYLPAWRATRIDPTIALRYE